MCALSATILGETFHFDAVQREKHSASCPAWPSDSFVCSDAYEPDCPFAILQKLNVSNLMAIIYLFHYLEKPQ